MAERPDLSWTESLAAEEDVRRLGRALALSERFHFYIVACPTYATATALLDHLAAQTSLARGTPVSVSRLDPYNAHDDFARPIRKETLLREVLEKLVAPPEGRAARNHIVAVDATRADAMDADAWFVLFQRLNETRNTVVSRTEGELLLLLPPLLYVPFALRAPDFWSIRSGEYAAKEMPPQQEALPKVTVSEADERLSGNALLDRLEDLRQEGDSALQRGDTDVALRSLGALARLAEIGLAREPDRVEWLSSKSVGLFLLARAARAAGQLKWEETYTAARGRAEKRTQERKIRRAPDVAQSYSPSPVSVLLSYSHRDARAAEELRKHLHQLTRIGLIYLSDPGQIEPGTDIDREIRRAFETADIVVALISPDYLASNPAIEADADRRRVIPVLVRSVSIDQTPLANRATVPRDGKSIADHTNRDRAWVEVVQAIVKVATEIQNQPIRLPRAKK